MFAAPRRGFGQLSNFYKLTESGDVKSFRSIPQVSAGGVPTFWDGKTTLPIRKR